MRAYKKIRTLKLVAEPTEFDNRKITSSLDSYEMAMPFYKDSMQIQEVFYAAYLNNSNKVIGMVEHFKGGITGTTVDIRLVAKHAIETLAVAVIIFHNHPSGTLKPSQPDITLTRKLKTALEYFDIKLLDHLILTGHGYHSFADEDLL